MKIKVPRAFQRMLQRQHQEYQRRGQALQRQQVSELHRKIKRLERKLKLQQHNEHQAQLHSAFASETLAVQLFWSVVRSRLFSSVRADYRSVRARRALAIRLWAGLGSRVRSVYRAASDEQIAPSGPC